MDLAAASEVASILESRISGSTAGADVQETGRVLTIGDGIARYVPWLFLSTTATYAALPAVSMVSATSRVGEHDSI